MVAAGGVAFVIVALAFAAHTRFAAAKPPFPAPPPCPVAAGGSGVDCGPASAAIRTAGNWQVIQQGRCVDRTRLYFGVHTANGDAPLSLMLDIPPGALAKGGGVRITNGQLALVSGATESLSGQAFVAPGGRSGAFTAHGQDAQGKPDGTTYTGAWTCRAGHTPRHVTQQTSQAHLPQCTQKDLRNAGHSVARDGYGLDCGPGSAIVWVGGRWRVVSPGICGYGGNFVDFGVFDGRYPRGADPHKTLQFHLVGFNLDASAVLRNRLLTGGALGVIDGEIDLPGAHTAPRGRAIVQRGGSGGAFDLNNRGGPTVGWPRADYVGAWACGGPPS